MAKPDLHSESDTVVLDHLPSEPTLAHLFEHLTDAVMLLDSGWRITFANATARQISHVLPQHLNSISFWDRYPEALGTSVEEAYRDVMTNRRECTLDAFFYEPFQIWFSIHVIPVPDGGIALYYHDITATHTAETALRSTTEQLQEVLAATTDGILRLDRDFRITYLNDRAQSMLAANGPSIGTILWESYPHTVYPNSPYVEHYTRAMIDRVASGFQAFYPEPFNFWLDVIARPAPNGIVVFFRDITQNKLREENLRSSEERYRILTELSPQCLWTARPEGNLDYANQRFLNYLGLESLPSDGTVFLSCIDPADLDQVVQAWTDGVASGQDYTIDARLIRASDRASRWWHLSASPLRDPSGPIQQWLGTATDVHEDRLADLRLREQYTEIDRQRRELETIYRGSPVGMALYEPTELRLLRINDRQAQIFRMSPTDAIGKTYEELTGGVSIAHTLIRRAAAGENVLNQDIDGKLDRLPSEYRYWNVNYSPIFDEDGNVRAIASATIETTQQKRAEAALMQSEKLAVVGRMASSIAHEINNPLESVTNLIYIARQNAASAEVQHLLDLADQELRRVSVITNQTLRFHKQATLPREISCVDLFTTVLSLYEGRLRNSSIAVEKRKRAEQPITCFEGDIRQVLNNLVANAIDAMPSGGRLSLRSREATDWRTGRKGLILTVADTGSGMSPETRANVFKAFYTTKGINGTGLGLWIGSEIVDRHDGRLLLRSSQNPTRHGTVFNLFLPFTPRHPSKNTTNLIQ